MAIYSIDGNYSSEMNQTSTSIRLTGAFVFLSALNIFLFITASLGNALILVALHKETSLHPPTKLLFRCLAVPDLCVGVISQPLFAFFLFSSVTTGMNWKVSYYIANTSSFILCGVSLFTSSAISVDRLQALLSGLRYRQVVTLPRARAVIFGFWLIGISCGAMFFWNITIALTVTLALIIFSLATSVFSYTKIYFKLRHRHQLQKVHPITQVQANGRQVPLNIARYKKSVSSALWMQLALVTCYIPFIVVVMLMTYGRMSGSKFQIARYVTLTLIHLNSSLNPILYF
jgi:hypothetical protein